MNASILCTLLAQRISPEQYQLHGLKVYWMSPEYDTPENRAIVADVITNYNTLETGYLESLKPTYAELRAKEYPSTDELIIALWEKVIEGRPETAATLQATREIIKVKYPKEK